MVSIASFAVDLHYGHTEYQLFNRSGALIVLAGAALEYQLSIDTYLGNVLKNQGFISMQEQDNSMAVTKATSMLQKYAHLLVLLGTIVWAYGDFIYVYI